MKKLILIIIIFSLNLTAQTEVNNRTKKSEALAFCWKNKGGLWWCDGPLQILWNGVPRIKIALKKVGCETHTKFRPWAGDSRVGYLFHCGSNLKIFDRNIRKRYGIK